MDLAAQETIQSLSSGFGVVWALVITYSFSVLGAALLIIVGYVIAGLVERGINGGLKRLPGFDATLRGFFAGAARYGVLILVAVMVLGQFGVQTASIIAAIGAIGLAIGLALQGTLQNIAAGVMLLVLRPFRIGETIEVGALMGTVEEIGLFATRLRTPEGMFILAPNTALWNEPILNFNRNKVRRNDITVGIGYDDNIDLAESVMRGIVRSDPRVLAEPEPVTFVAALGDSAVAVSLRYWTSDQDFLTTKTDLTKLVKVAFDANGISIPFPQQEVVYRDARPPLDASPLRS